MLLFVRGVTSCAKGDFEDALALFQKLGSVTGDALLIAEMCKAKLGTSEDVAASAEVFIRKFPYSHAGYVLRGEAKLDKGEYDAAQKDFTIGINKAHKSTDKHNLSKWYCYRGLASTSLGEYRRALNELKSSTELDPKNALAYSCTGEVFAHLGDFRSALKSFSKALAYTDDPKSVLSLRGSIYLAMGKIKEAENDFAKASQIDPKNADDIELLGLCYLHKGDLKKAENYFQRIVGNYPDSVSCYVGLAHLRFTKSLYAEARKYLDKIFSLDYQNVQALWMLALIELFEEDYFASLKTFDQLLSVLRVPFFYALRGIVKAHLEDAGCVEDVANASVANEYSPWGHVSGYFSLVMKDNFKPEASLTKGIEVNRENYYLFYLRATLRYQRKNYRGALDDIDIVLGKKPKLIDALLLKAEILFRLRQYSKAAAEIKILLKENPKFAPAHLLLGKILYEDPKKKEGRSYRTF